MGPAIVDRPLSYQHRLDGRSLDQITTVVVHCTELPDLHTAREYAEVIHYAASQTGNSGHYYITREGHIERWVEPGFIAHHVADQNQHTIGIELVNLGRYPNWHARDATMRQPYPNTQIKALIGLINGLCGHLPALADICGHEDLDLMWVPASDDPSSQVRRKLDPGPLFPWQTVLDQIELVRATTPHR